MMPSVETVTREDLAAGTAAALLALNNAHAADLTLLDATRFAQLVGMAYLTARIGTADALLLAFDQDAAYDSPNFLWFRERFERFVYVDRVVVAATRRGRGLGRALYAALFERATAAGHARVVCEINTVPPNPGSDAFHAMLGFRTVGSAILGNGKTVRYVERPLP